MGTAYTPGLKISGNTTIRKTRRLPLKGKVLVKEGELVQHDTVVARAEIPGPMQTAKVANVMGIEPNEVESVLTVHAGDKVEKGQILAASKSFFGLFKNECRSPIGGTIEIISTTTGHVGIRENPSPIEISAYVDGCIKEVLPEEGVIVETRGALIQGIFGVGGERQGIIHQAVNSPDDVLEESNILPEHQGKILAGGSLITREALQKAVTCHVAGIVVGGVVDQDLMNLLGFDIGVAITGEEKIGFTLILTEGFGKMRMAERTFNLLKSLEGKMASINGATQIRAGVIRPEIIVPLDQKTHADQGHPQDSLLEIGTSIRLIREPYFGMLGKVTELPAELQELESGALVRVLKAELETGEIVTVPRANVEILEE